MIWLVLAIHPQRKTERVECFTYLAKQAMQARYEGEGYAVIILPRLR